MNAGALTRKITVTSRRIPNVLSSLNSVREPIHTQMARRNGARLLLNTNEAAQQYGFEAFAKMEFYRTVNARLMDLTDVGQARRIVDLSCGTGAMTRLILERLQSGSETLIYAIDHSTAALKKAMNDLEAGSRAQIKFIDAEVETLDQAVGESVDTIIFGNAIHYVKDKSSLLGQIGKTLRPGGTFAFNTSFFRGAHPPETEEFARRWMMAAIRTLRREHGLKRRKSKKPEARSQLSSSQYARLLQQEGFKIIQSETCKVNMPLEGWCNISAFEDFIEGVLPGVPLDKASDVLKSTCRDVFERCGLEFVPRNWLQIVSVRT